MCKFQITNKRLYFHRQCVLASIIVVALKGMLMKVTEFKRFWKLDKTDGVIWAVTFISVILMDVEYGLLIGIVLCIGKLILFSIHPYTCSLALVPGTELYLDTKRYKSVWNNDSLSFLFFSSFIYIYSSYRVTLKWESISIKGDFLFRIVYFSRRYRLKRV